MTCTVVQEREQPRLYDVVSRAGRTGNAFAVLDPTWPQPFLGMATGQVHAAAVGAHLILRDDNPPGATTLHCVPSQLPGLLDLAECSPYLARGYLAAAVVPVTVSAPSLGLQDPTRTVPRFAGVSGVG